mgnify:CR=1 FL=1
MAKEWRQICKDCGETFGYSDTSYQTDIAHGFSRPERCPKHREMHGKEISKVGCSHFLLKPRTEPYPILGLPYLGYISHGTRIPELKEYPPDTKGMSFGITDKDIQDLYEALKNHQVIVVVGPTGSGKSTYLPFRLVEPLGLPRDFFTKNGPVIVTQPRIQATRMIPEVVGEKLLGSSVGPGYEVGYRYRHADEYDGRNRLIYVTDGSLLNWIAEGKIGQYSIIMIDEAHERSCNIDLILSLLKRELQKYPYLRLIIASATIDAEGFIRSFQDITDPKLLEFQGKKSFGYTVKHWTGEPIPERDLPNAMSDTIIDILKTTADGGILGFLNGESEIKRAVERLEEHLEILKRTKAGSISGILHAGNNSNGDIPIWVFPLYRSLGVEVGKEALGSLEAIPLNGKKIIPRRVVIATNIAETSLTVPDVVYVVDSGMIKQTEWDITAKTTRLIPRRHSKDGCKQRWGRTGRVKPGFVYTLYTKEEYDAFSDHTSPEITRSCLEDIMLTAKAAGISNPERLPWIEKPSDLELNRVNKVLEKRKIIDNDGDLTENGLELYRLHMPLDQSSLLILADRFGCAIEAATALAFLPYMGANLYQLFRWDSRWDAKTKSDVNAIQEGLRAGCRDDLALASKIATLYLRAEAQVQSDVWTQRYFLNEATLKQALDERNKMVEALRRDAEKDKQIRDINISLLERLRLIMAVSWPDKIVNLKIGHPITYPVESGSDEPAVGIVSEYSAGDWSSQQNAICGSMIRKIAIIDGKKNEAPSSCFMVQLPKQVPKAENAVIAIALSQLRKGKNDTNEKKLLFIDQRFPIGSKVSIDEKNGKYYVSDVIEFPLKTEEKFKRSLGSTECTDIRSSTEDVAKLEDNSDIEMKDGGEKEINEELDEEKDNDKDMNISHQVSFEKTDKTISSVEGIWAGSEKGKYANIIGWINREGMPIAVLSPIMEPGRIETLDKKKGDSIRVKIQRVFTRDPHDNAGWILARTSMGLDIPIELNEMSLSPIGHGLKRIEGQILDLAIKDISKTGWPQLTNIDKVINDLRDLRKQASSGSNNENDSTGGKHPELNGYVELIKEDCSGIVVIVPRAHGVIHHFEINKKYIQISNPEDLQIGDEVIIRLVSRKGEEKISADYLKEADTAKISKKWPCDPATSKLIVPYCLEDDDFYDLPLSPEAIDYYKKRSWQYCFDASVVARKLEKDAYGGLKQDNCVTGKIIETTEYKDGRFSGFSFQIEAKAGQETIPIMGFLPKSEFSWHEIESPMNIAKSQKRITVRILEIEDTLPPRLKVSRKRAFIAEAMVPKENVGYLIGKNHSRINEIHKNNDVGVDPDSIPGKVFVYAPTKAIKDSVCEQISAKVPGAGKWVNR